MEMHQIRYFVALARTLNFTRAADECNVTQPSLTRAIKLLEHELGGELVRRERGLTHLTELGERMLPLMTACFESAASAKSMADAMRTRKVAALRLALPAGVSAEPFTPHLTELLRAFPGLGLRILRGDAASVAETLREGGADLAVATPEGMDWDRFECWPLFREPLGLAVPASRPPSDPCAPPDLSGARLLLRGDCAVAGATEAAFAGTGVDIDAAVRVCDDGDMGALLAAGVGVGAAPASAALPPGARLDRADWLALSRELRLWAVRGRQRGPAAAMMVTQLRAADWSRYERAGV